MKTLLVLLLVSGLVAESSAWPTWSEFKESVKDFVTGKKGEFEKLSNAMKGKLQKLEDCERCDDGSCNDDDNIKCQELYINYSKVNDFMDCTDDSTRNDCALNLGKGATPLPKRELSQTPIGLSADKEVAEEDDTAELKLERRVASVILKALQAPRTSGGLSGTGI